MVTEPKTSVSMLRMLAGTPPVALLRDVLDDAALGCSVGVSAGAGCSDVGDADAGVDCGADAAGCGVGTGFDAGATGCGVGAGAVTAGCDEGCTGGTVGACGAGVGCGVATA